MLRDKYYMNDPTLGASYSGDFNNGNVPNMPANSLAENISLSKEECSGMFEFDNDIHQPTERAKLDLPSKSPPNEMDKKLDLSPNSPDLMRDSGIGMYI